MVQSVLRILDCFLLEGAKVLFRVGLGVLKVNAHHLLSITDPVALFQTLKEIAKHTFDIDQLLKVSYTSFVSCLLPQFLLTHSLSLGGFHWNASLSFTSCLDQSP